MLSHRRKNKPPSTRIHCKLFCYSASIVRFHGTINDYCRCILVAVMTRYMCFNE
ncbi:hypothetical protein RchiOBHm_Chr5g0050491 [Rosa chinensis]|uniref:Uncharacterized protein n=1 Tax=Rosa chinensis TaxID=74649 RepID=A0A2P6QF48_ROSCH|nr:hypothetical protein RchiOBHm_Chr5g0050491 [Rosa chinensis]